MNNFRLVTVSGLCKVMASQAPKLPESSGTMLCNESFGFQVSGYNNSSERILKCSVEVSGTRRNGILTCVTKLMN